VESGRAKKGKQLGDRNYKVYLDGYNQMDMITGKGPSECNRACVDSGGDGRGVNRIIGALVMEAESRR
jgi:hypothetical protein